MPTLQEVTDQVKAILANKAGIDASIIISGNKLTEWPLSLDDTALGFIALELAKYVEALNAAATVKVSEVKKDGLTVDELIKLIYNKVA